MDDRVISVLLAEDNESHALLMKRRLGRDESFAIHVAEDGIACLEKLAQASYDVLLLDHNLPKVDGLEILKRVGEQGHDTPVIMITGEGSETVAVQAMKEGAYDYIVKSREYLTTLPLVIRKAVEKHRLLVEHERIEQEIKQRNRELTILNSIAQIVGQPLDLQQMLSQALSKTLELMKADGGIIHLWDENTGELVCTAADSLPVEAVQEMAKFKPGEGGLTSQVVESGQPIAIENLPEAPETAMPMVSTTRIKSLVGVPLRARCAVKGVMSIGSSSQRQLGPEDISLLTTIGDQIGVAIENARLYDAAKKRMEELTLLNRVTTATTSTLDLQEVLQVMAGEMAATFAVEQCAIALLDESRHQATVIAEYLAPGRPSALGDAIPVQDNPATEQVIATRTPLAIFDAQKDPLLAPVHHLMKKRGTKSLLIVPLVVKGDVIGTVGVDVVQSQHEFTPEEITLAQAIANQAAIAIENARLYDTARKRIAELTALQEIGLRLTQSLHPSEVLQAIADNALNLFQASDVHIFLYDEDDDELTFAAAAWASAEDSRDLFKHPRKDGLTATVAHTGQPLLISETGSHPLFATYDDWRQSMEAIAGFPLKRGDKVIGIFNIAFSSPHTFDDDELRLAMLLTDQATVAIQNARLFQEVVESKQSLESLISSSPDAIVTTDEHGIITFYSEGAEQIHAFEARECLGQPASSYYRGGKEEARKVMDMLRREEKVQGYETEFVRKGGSVVPISLSASLLRDDKGQIMGTVGIGRDITRQKILQSQLLQAEKLSAIGHMIAGVAHELNNPLTTVMGYSELLQASDVDDQTKEDLQRIHQDARRAQRIVENLLAFARQKKPQKGMVDINEILERTLDLRRYQFTVDNVRVVKELEGNLPWILADGYQLQQVFLKILNNAYQAMVQAPGGGTLIVRTERRASRDQAGDVIRITFADDGPGIRAELMDRIFDPFFTTKDVGLGAGLGLSISFGIIQEHKGRIWAESEIGQGATFFVELPVERWHPKMIEMPLEKRLETPTSKRILVVDDEETVAEVIARALAKQGHVVDAVLSAGAALEKLTNNDYDLIVSDIRMPGLSGKQLYEQIKEFSPSLAQHIIFTTGDTINPPTEQFLQETKNAYIVKPFQLNELQKLIDEAGDDLTTPSPGERT